MRQPDLCGRPLEALISTQAAGVGQTRYETRYGSSGRSGSDPIRRAIKIAAWRADEMGVFALNDSPTLETVARSAAHIQERRLEVEVLLQAINTLRRDDILTDAEFEAKRQRLTANG